MKIVIYTKYTIHTRNTYMNYKFQNRTIHNTQKFKNLLPWSVYGSDQSSVQYTIYEKVVYRILRYIYDYQWNIYDTYTKYTKIYDSIWFVSIVSVGAVTGYDEDCEITHKSVRNYVHELTMSICQVSEKIWWDL